MLQATVQILLEDDAQALIEFVLIPFWCEDWDVANMMPAGCHLPLEGCQKLEAFVPLGLNKPS